MDDNNTDVHFHENPLPTDFLAYTPWACRRYQLECFPVITEGKIEEEEDYKNYKIRGSESQTNSNLEARRASTYNSGCTTNIVAIFNTDDSLVQLKFQKNTTIPRKLLKLLCLIVPFHKKLTAIYIDSGLNQKSLYDLHKLIDVSQITEVILDNNKIKQANYYILLENTRLRYLSLARCNLNDDAVRELASRLVFPLSASKTLTALILSINRITDEGALHLGNMLRTNRQLAYLNLAGNKITDAGANSILSSLIEFSLTPEEIFDSKHRKYNFFKARNNFVKETIMKVAAKLGENPIVKKTTGNLSGRKLKFSQIEQRRSLTVVQTDAVEAYAKKQFGEFQDPFSSEAVVYTDKDTYCLGNNTLCYISLAYNDISYFSVVKLLTVLTKQVDLSRTPRGLVNVSIEGNNIPDCHELASINFIIDAYLSNCVETQTKVKPKSNKKGK